MAATLADLRTRLTNGEFASSGNALKSVARCGLTDTEKNVFRGLVAEHFGVAGTGKKGAAKKEESAAAADGTRVAKGAGKKGKPAAVAAAPVPVPVEAPTRKPRGPNKKKAAEAAAQTELPLPAPVFPPAQAAPDFIQVQPPPSYVPPALMQLAEGYGPLEPVIGQQVAAVQGLALALKDFSFMLESTETLTLSESTKQVRENVIASVFETAGVAVERTRRILQGIGPQDG